ncbi:hypothetical protein [Streptomyces sp. HGB0020]|uniref:hypothetical protein n=1 Tax=Streptomyces sp. HGB0020 TaxID=1078086 RepID=UPI00034E631F|nr:hypothetical protein [Streptomyces sp. HGB0020]EPD57807.1 hypothetical protein HMPREF1211_06145 [Streptomyces sp. HGB0020]
MFGRFWIDFIIGDDWKVAAAVVTALSLLVGALSLGVLGEAELTVLGGVVMVAAFTVGLAIDVRRNRGG